MRARNVKESVVGVWVIQRIDDTLLLLGFKGIPEKRRMEIKFSEEKSAKIHTWKAREGFYLPVGHVILSYFQLDESGQPLKEMKRLKTTQSGVIKTIHAKNGQVVSNG